MGTKERTRWPVPTVVDPPDRLCTVVSVPNDREHIAAFMGALYNLAIWDNWKHDNAHTGKLAAAVWWDIWQNITVGACGLVANGDSDVQFRQNGCKLEFSIDCVHWNTLYDPTECIQAMIQPSGGGILQPGECREYDVSVPANGVWFLPFAVSEGYTLEVTDARGAWAPILNVGPVPVPWYCPDGRSFLLGGCVGSPATNANGADPSLNYMSVLSRLDLATPVWFDVMTGIQTIGAGISNAALWFQANSNDLATGQGAVGFHLKVCNTNAGASWCHFFNLTIGLAPAELSITIGSFVEGTGLVSATQPNGSESIVASLLFADTRLTSVVIETCFDGTPSGGGSGSSDALYLNSALVAAIDTADIYTGCRSHTWTGDTQVDQVYMNPSGATLTGITITGVTISGTGTNPFGTDNCP